MATDYASLGYVILRNWRGEHARGLNGFDSRCDIDGLKDTMENASAEVAEYVWNCLFARASSAYSRDGTAVHPSKL